MTNLFTKEEREARIEQIVAQFPKEDRKAYRKQFRKLSDAELLSVKIERN